MKARKNARLLAEQSRRCSMRRCMVDDESTGFWAEKRARQARSRELVRTGQRSQQSMLLFPPEIVRQMKVRHRTRMPS